MKKEKTKREEIFASIFFKIMLIAFFSIIVFGLPDIVAEENDSEDSSGADGEQTKIDNAYDCLIDLIEDKGCSELSSEQRILGFLSAGKCKDEFFDDSEGDGECWPKGNCDLKSSSQAYLALDKYGLSTEKVSEWLEENSGTPDSMTWFLQVESGSSTECEVSYDNNSHSFGINEDKTIDSSPGSCFSLSSPGNYWLRISSSCYDTEFEISCDTGFQTNLLFRKQGSDTVHVLGDTTSSGAEGTSTEKIDVKCLEDPQTESCNYEGTLWGSLAFYKEEKERDYIPYLISMKDSNDEFFPASFLYYLTGDEGYLNEIQNLQREDSYWDISDGSKFYDTSLALKSLSSGTSAYSNAIDWLLEEGVQGDNGCWQNSITDTSLVLWAGWNRDLSDFDGDDDDDDGDGEAYCDDAGFDCVSDSFCEDSDVRSDLSCEGSGEKVCCESPLTCEKKDGSICNSEQECEGGEEVSAYDIGTGETCCKDGTCSDIEDDEDDEDGQACRDADGACHSSCTPEEEELEDYSSSCPSNEICCVEADDDDDDDEDEEGNLFWIFLLLVLILLVVFGIIFRDKIKDFFLKMKSGSNGGKGSKGPPKGPPNGPPGRGPPGRYLGRPTGRKMPPPGARSRRSSNAPPNGPPGRRPPSGSNTNRPLDNTLQKLKEQSQS